MNFKSNYLHKDTNHNYNFLLKHQLSLWNNLLGLNVELNEFFRNPLREDKNPGARLKKLGTFVRLLDSSSNLNNTSIFEAIKIIHSCNFQEACDIAFNKYLSSYYKNLYNDSNKIITTKYPVKIKHQKTNWNLEDKDYWGEKTLITKKQLELEKYNPVSAYWISNKYTGEFKKFIPKHRTYINNINNRYKIYCPKTRLFLSNLKSSDIGGNKKFNSIRELWLTKNSKSYMCLCNIDLNSRYVTHEGVGLNIEYINYLNENFDTVYILYDNDVAGILSSNKLADYINSIFPGLAVACNIPKKYLTESYIDTFKSKKEIKDPFDLTKKYSLELLVEEIKIIRNER